jgi:N-acetylmuramoyl-L-alanine amidase
MFELDRPHSECGRFAVGARLARLAALALLVAAAAGPALAQAPLPEASAARIVGDDSRTRFVVDLSDRIGFSVFKLADPYRIVVDLPEIAFALDPETGQAGRGLISAFRYGLISAGKSRIVLDMTTPVAVDKVFLLDPADGQPARLVVDVVPTTREAFLQAVRQESRERLDQPVDRQATRPVPKPGDGRLRVVLDPGHGGIDSGAVGADKTLEKEVVLAFAEQLAAALDETGRYDVLLTREDDSFVRLSERVEIARRFEADLFVSIHADSFRGSGVRGATVYTLSEKASHQMAAEIAATENRADIIAGLEIDDGADEVADILLDLTRRETKNFSIVLARDLVQNLRPAVRLFKNPHQQAGFVVLKAPDIPSVLMELGYLSNAEDEELLHSSEWRQKAVAAMVQAIDSYFVTRVARGAIR